MKNVAAFFERVELDRELQAKLKVAGNASDAAVVEIAAAAGYEFTTAELGRLREGQREYLRHLSEKELMAVAGGAARPSGCCFYARGCMPSNSRAW